MTAFKMIKEYETIENVIYAIKEKNKSGKSKKQHIIPDPYPYEEARNIFKNCETSPELLNKEVRWIKKKFLSSPKILTLIVYME